MKVDIGMHFDLLYDPILDNANEYGLAVSGSSGRLTIWIGGLGWTIEPKDWYWPMLKIKYKK